MNFLGSLTRYGRPGIVRVRIKNDRMLCLSLEAHVQLPRHKERGVNPKRQSCAHVHQVTEMSCKLFPVSDN
jgi:hypothetical protein